MLSNTVVDQYNLNLINYTCIFNEHVSLPVVDELYDLNLLIDDSIKLDRTAMRAITHHLLESVCSNIIAYKGPEVPVFTICESCILDCELNRYLSESTNLGAYVVRQFKQLHKMTGVNFLVIDTSFDKFITNMKQRDGDTIEMLNTLSTYKPRDLSKLFNYFNKQGLVGLKQKFFETQQYKQVFI